MLAAYSAGESEVPRRYTFTFYGSFQGPGPSCTPAPNAPLLRTERERRGQNKNKKGLGDESDREGMGQTGGQGASSAALNGGMLRLRHFGAYEKGARKCPRFFVFIFVVPREYFLLFPSA